MINLYKRQVNKKLFVKVLLCRFVLVQLIRDIAWRFDLFRRYSVCALGARDCDFTFLTDHAVNVHWIRRLAWPTIAFLRMDRDGVYLRPIVKCQDPVFRYDLDIQPPINSPGASHLPPRIRWSSLQELFAYNSLQSPSVSSFLFRAHFMTTYPQLINNWK